MKNVYIATTCARLALLAVTVFTAPVAHAIDGSYDTSWGDGGRLQVDASAGSDVGKTLLLQPDGKLLMAGACVGNSLCATRQMPDGSFDTSFGPTEHPGRAIFTDVPFDVLTLSAAALTSAGGVMLAGNDSDVAATPVNYGLLVKLDAYGNHVGHMFIEIASYKLNAIAMQADGKIVVAASVASNTYDFAITRILADLSGYDQTFGDALGTKMVGFPGGSDDVANAVAVQPDGKIVVAGRVDSKVGVVRLLANGQLDDDPVRGFGDAGLATFSWGTQSSANEIKVDRDGSLLVAGYAGLGTGANASYDFFVNRLTPRGRQDSNFNYECTSNGGGITCSAGAAFIAFDLGGTNADQAQALAVQSDGKILVSGFAQRNDGVAYFAVARRYPDGRPDFSFGDNGQTYGRYGPAADNNDTASAIAVGNGGIMIAGASKLPYSSDYRFGIAKLQLDLIFADGME